MQGFCSALRTWRQCGDKQIGAVERVKHRHIVFLLVTLPYVVVRIQGASAWSGVTIAAFSELELANVVEGSTPVLAGKPPRPLSSQACDLWCDSWQQNA